MKHDIKHELKRGGGGGGGRGDLCNRQKWQSNVKHNGLWRKTVKVLPNGFLCGVGLSIYSRDLMDEGSKSPLSTVSP